MMRILHLQQALRLLRLGALVLLLLLPQKKLLGTRTVGEEDFGILD